MPHRFTALVTIILTLLGTACAAPRLPTPTAAPTVAPTTTPPPTPLPVTYATFESDLLGFAMPYPDDWIVEANEGGGAIIIATEADLLQAREVPDDGALVTVLFIRGELLETLLPAGTPPKRTNQPGVLERVQDLFFQPEDGARRVDDPREVKINDVPAAQVDLATGINAQELRFMLTTFGAENQVVAVMTGTPAASYDTYRPILQTMVNSIVLSEPPE